MLLLAALLQTAPALGPEAARCASGGGPAMLVEITGLKSRTGTVRVRSYGGATSTWFNNKKYLTRIQVPTPTAGPIAICVAVPRPGQYAVDVRHDANGNGQTDRSDGGGASGNPHVTLFGMMFGSKPSPKVTAVTVGTGVTVVPVTMMYLSGTSFRPIGR